MEAGLQKVAYTWPTIAVVNDPSSGVADQEVAAMVEACQQQLLRDFGPIWHIGAHLVPVLNGGKPPAGAWCIALLGSSDQAGALGYHDLTPDGLPLGKVFAGTDRQYGESVSVTLSHELLEMLGDPWINLAAQASDGKFYAWETCDAVEADALGYAIDGVQLSAFVTPTWFGNGAGPVAFPDGRVSAAFELAPGGYVSVFDPSSGQGWQQVQTSRSIAASLEELTLEQVKAVPRVGSRRERRFRGSAAWVHSTYALG